MNKRPPYFSPLPERLRRRLQYEYACRQYPALLIEKRFVRVGGGYLNRWLIREERLVIVFPPPAEAAHLRSSPVHINSFFLPQLGKPWEGDE
ncbi:MAG: hypothetical protein V4706_02745 [Pseudomonadota bacterium]